MTQYERGTKLERDLQHYWEYRHCHYVMRSAGSHGPADLIYIGPDWVWLVQCKLHDKLRDDQREKELVQIPRPKYCIPCTAWKRKRGKKTFIVMHNLLNGNELEIEPLSKEQEKKYQEMKKEKIAARKSTGVRVLSNVRETKEARRPKS